MLFIKLYDMISSPFRSFSRGEGKGKKKRKTGVKKEKEKTKRSKKGGGVCQKGK